MSGERFALNFKGSAPSVPVHAEPNQLVGRNVFRGCFRRERSLAVPSKDYLIKQVATLLKFARQTSDPGVAAVLLGKAADLNEKVEQLPSLQTDMSPSPPDVLPTG